MKMIEIIADTIRISQIFYDFKSADIADIGNLGSTANSWYMYFGKGRADDDPASKF